MRWYNGDAEDFTPSLLPAPGNVSATMPPRASEAIAKLAWRR